MAINYPSTLDTATQFGKPTGSNFLAGTDASGIDHAGVHDNLSILGTALENILGTTPGTNLFNPGIKTASDQVLGMNSGGTLNQTITKGTINNALLGTPTMQTFLGSNQGTIIGTAQAQLFLAGTGDSNAYDTVNFVQGGANNTWYTSHRKSNANEFWIGYTPDNVTFYNPIKIKPLSPENSIIIGTKGVSFGESIYPAVGTITDSAGGTFTVDAGSSQIYYSAMGTAAGNRTLGTPTNPQNYQQLTYAFKASGSANGTLVWSSAFRISQDFGTPALGTGVSWNYFNWRYNAIDTKWDFLGQVLNLV